MAFDPFFSPSIIQDLQMDGIACVEFRQSLENYNPACVKLEELLIERKFRHGGHPVLRWMAGNVVTHTDGRGYKMPSRKKSTEKIDGIAAVLMALGLAIAEPAPTFTVEAW
jgi:phage terminase large subunit-like protein